MKWRRSRRHFFLSAQTHHCLAAIYSGCDNPGMMEAERDPEGLPGAATLTKGVTRGVCRGLADLGYCVLTEFSLKNGRRADVIGLGKSGDVVIVEVKVTTADFLGDRKWPDYGEFCDRLSFAVPPEFPQELLPAECGLMVADAYGAEIIREAPQMPMHASRRKALTLRFARSAATRLQGLCDPGPSSIVSPGLIASPGLIVNGGLG